MTAADEAVQVSHEYAVTRSYLIELVEASANGGETDSAFVALALSLRGANPDNLARLLAAAVLRIAAAERERADHCEEIARLNAALGIAEAHTKKGNAS